MKTILNPTLLGITLLAATMAGCGHRGNVASYERSKQAEPIWTAPTVPTAMGLVQIVPEETARVALEGTTPGGFGGVLGVRGTPSAMLRFETRGSVLHIHANPGADGIAVVDVALQDRATGLPHQLSFPVIVTSYPTVDFVYTPPEGTTPTRVSVAGAFNGWSMDRDPMQEGDDGVFRLRKGVAPGTWTYKLVVDGEWMADPANPEQDSSGFGNSVLRVAGNVAGTLNFSPLAAGMAGAGPQGGFIARLQPEEELKKVTVFAGNRLLDSGEYEVSETDGTILFRIEDDLWGAENYAVVTATTSKGRRGGRGGWFTHAEAPRSPRDEVIYFAMTDRFHDGDPTLNRPSNDPRVHPLADYKGGDWAGIRQKIEEGYFEKLGVTTLWISPLNQNTQKVEKESVEPGDYYTSYHGYWPISFTETNEQFGSIADLQDLVSTAHKNDIAVLIDFVANHVHEDHPLFQQYPHWQSPLELPDGKRNIREFDAHPLTTWFDTFLPTIDYVKNPEASAYMWENAVYWLETSGADGFRQDAVKHLPVEFWEGLTARVNERFPDRFVYQVGETISGYDTVAAYVGPHLMQGQFDFPGYFAARSVLGQGTGSMADLADTFTGAERYYPASSIMSPLLGNHDMSRFMAYADGDLPDGANDKDFRFQNQPEVDNEESFDKLRLGFAWLLTIPGPPTLYYGDEIGMTGAADPDNRRMMQWDNWTEQQQRSFDTFAELATVRNNSVALRRGGVDVLHADDERLVFARISPDEVVIAALSRQPKDSSITIVVPPHWGTGLSLAPLAESTSTATIDGNRLRITDGPWGYGVWKVKGVGR